MSTDQLIDRLKELAAAHGEHITVHQFCRLARISDRAVYVAFPGGWRELRQAAGLPPTSIRLRHEDEALLDGLWRLWHKLQRVPTWAEIDRLAPASTPTYVRRFGGKRELMRAVLDHSRRVTLARAGASVEQATDARPR